MGGWAMRFSRASAVQIRFFGPPAPPREPWLGFAEVFFQNFAPPRRRVSKFVRVRAEWHGNKDGIGFNLKSEVHRGVYSQLLGAKRPVSGSRCTDGCTFSLSGPLFAQDLASHPLIPTSDFRFKQLSWLRIFGECGEFAPPWLAPTCRHGILRNIGIHAAGRVHPLKAATECAACRWRGEAESRRDGLNGRPWGGAGHRACRTPCRSDAVDSLIPVPFGSGLDRFVVSGPRLDFRRGGR